MLFIICDLLWNLEEISTGYCMHSSVTFRVLDMMSALSRRVTHQCAVEDTRSLQATWSSQICRRNIFLEIFIVILSRTYGTELKMDAIIKMDNEEPTVIYLYVYNINVHCYYI